MPKPDFLLGGGGGGFERGVGGVDGMDGEGGKFKCGMMMTQKIPSKSSFPLFVFMPA